MIRLINHTQIRLCAIFSCYLRHNDGLRWDMSLVIYYSKLWNHNIGTWDRNYTKGIVQCSIAASLYSVLSMWIFMDYVWNDAVHWWVWFIVICTYITKCIELKYVQFSTCNVFAHYFFCASSAFLKHIRILVIRADLMFTTLNRFVIKQILQNENE